MMHCQICDRGRAAALFSFPLSEVYYCPQCTGVFSIPRVDTNTLYDAAYFKNNYAYITEQQLNKFKHLIVKIKEYKEMGSVIDVGCGTGIFLEVISKNGFTDNVGVDVSEYAVRQARKQVGATAEIFNSIEEVSASKRFDVVSFVDSIAHIPSVDHLLQKLLVHHAKNDSILFVRTPNFTVSVLRYARLLSYFIPQKYLSRLFFVPNRRLLFNARSMKAFLKKYSLDILYIAEFPDYSREIKITSLKQWVCHVIFYKLPRWLNPKNSMLVIAKRAGAL